MVGYGGAANMGMTAGMSDMPNMHLTANTAISPMANAPVSPAHHVPCHAPVAAYPWNNSSAILVLFVLLVIISRTIGPMV